MHDVPPPDPMPVVLPEVAPPYPTLELASLEVRLGSRRLNLTAGCRLFAGRLYLVTGKSGSGKSSFARALLGFGELTSPPATARGDVSLTDASGQSHPLWRGNSYQPAARQQIAFLPQSERLGFLDGLSLVDNLTLFSRLGRQADVEIKRLAEQFALDPLPARIATASGGERIRLSAIRGLLPRQLGAGMPAVVIADEPTAGLDRVAAASVVRLLSDLARSGESVVLVITHEPESFAVGWGENADDDAAVHIVECPLDSGGADGIRPREVGELRLLAAEPPRRALQDGLADACEFLSQLGSVALSPLAFAWGLLGLHRPLVLLRQVLLDGFGPGTQAFSLSGCLLIAGTVAYFIFERMPKPELVEPLLLPEILGVTGHALVRVVLPLAACSLVAAKLGAAQSARLAAAVRGGLLETLAMAAWRLEAYALVPVVLAQFLAMLSATVIALVCGILLAAVVYVAGHERASLPLTINLMIDGLQHVPHGWQYLLAKVWLSSFLAGTIAALYGISPSRAGDDVARAVHRTLLWSVLAVIACQCGLILAEFAH